MPHTDLGQRHSEIFRWEKSGNPIENYVKQIQGKKRQDEIVR
jgi:hypothetical protein